MLNVILLEQRLGLISAYLMRLNELATIPEDQFLSDPVLIAAAESFLRRTLEAIFDIGRHVLAKSGFLDLAGEYKSIARGLADRGFVDQSLGDALVAMAGYRNRMVHLYNEITAEELRSIIINDSGDIRDFARQMREFLRQRGPDQNGNSR